MSWHETELQFPDSLVHTGFASYLHWSLPQWYLKDIRKCWIGRILYPNATSRHHMYTITSKHWFPNKVRHPQQYQKTPQVHYKINRKLKRSKKQTQCFLLPKRRRKIQSLPFAISLPPVIYLFLEKVDTRPEQILPQVVAKRKEKAWKSTTSVSSEIADFH